MSEKTKACSLTEVEIESLLAYHGRSLDNCSAIKQDKSDIIERLSYLNKRLKSFNEVEEIKPSTGAWPNG